MLNNGDMETNGLGGDATGFANTNAGANPAALVGWVGNLGDTLGSIGGR